MHFCEGHAYYEMVLEMDYIPMILTSAIIINEFLLPSNFSVKYTLIFGKFFVIFKA